MTRFRPVGLALAYLIMALTEFLGRGFRRAAKISAREMRTTPRRRGVGGPSSGAVLRSKRSSKNMCAVRRGVLAGESQTEDIYIGRGAPWSREA